METHPLPNWEPSRSLKLKLKKAEILKKKLADYEQFKKSLEEKRKSELLKRNRLKQIISQHQKLEKRLEAAAIVIQRFARGYLVRKRTAHVQLYLEKRRLECYLSELKTQIDYCYMHIGEVAEKSAIKIQSHARRYMVRMKYIHDLEKRRQDIIQGKMLAAVMIQKNVRRFLERCRYLRYLEEIRQKKLKEIGERLRFGRVKKWWSVNKYKVGTIKRHYDALNAAEKKSEIAGRSRRSSAISSTSPRNVNTPVLSKLSYFRSRSIGMTVLQQRYKSENPSVNTSLVSSDSKSRNAIFSMPRTPEHSKTKDLPTVISTNASPEADSPQKQSQSPYKSPTKTSMNLPPQLGITKVPSRFSSKRSSTQIKPRPPPSEPPGYLRPTLNLMSRWQVEEDLPPTKKKIRKLRTKPSYLKSTASSDLRIKTAESERKRGRSSESKIINTYRMPNMIGYETTARISTVLTSSSISKPKMPTFIEDCPTKTSQDHVKPLSVLQPEFQEIEISPRDSVPLLTINDDNYLTYKENISHVVFSTSHTEHTYSFPTEEEKHTSLLPLTEQSIELNTPTYLAPRVTSQKFESALPEMFYFVNRYGSNTTRPVKDFMLHTERPSTSGESSMNSYLMINRYKL
jgi:hypothetical protein